MLHAARDGEKMGQVYRYLGMSVGVVQSYQLEAARRAAYDCDVTYVANQELGFDYLRDNLAMSTLRGYLVFFVGVYYVAV